VIFPFMLRRKLRSDDLNDFHPASSGEMNFVPKIPSNKFSNLRADKDPSMALGVTGV
jgi:hypothetical protein